MVFPGFSDSSVNPRTRMLIALVITVVMYPLLRPVLPTMPADTGTFFMLVGIEFMVGILYATAAKLFMTTLNVAGELISFASGFQAATLFDPDSGANTLAPALLLIITANMLIFSLELHHLMIEGIYESYQIFPAGQMPLLADGVQAIVQTISNVFVTSLKVAAPVMVTGFIGYVSFGVFNRLIPQLHAFFVAIPIILGVGVMMLGLTLGTVLTLFMQDLSAHLSTFNVVVEAEPVH